VLVLEAVEDANSRKMKTSFGSSTLRSTRCTVAFSRACGRSWSNIGLQLS
jgi:hypothetical protein